MSEPIHQGPSEEAGDDHRQELKEPRDTGAGGAPGRLEHEPRDRHLGHDVAGYGKTVRGQQREERNPGHD